MYRTCRGADRIAVDADALSGDAVAPGLSRDEALERFHVIDRSGRAFSGGAAGPGGAPAFSMLGRILSCWPFSIMLEGIYRLFLILSSPAEVLSKCAGTELSRHGDFAGRGRVGDNQYQPLYRPAPDMAPSPRAADVRREIPRRISYRRGRH